MATLDVCHISGVLPRSIFHLNTWKTFPNGGRKVHWYRSPGVLSPLWSVEDGSFGGQINKLTCPVSELDCCTLLYIPYCVRKGKTCLISSLLAQICLSLPSICKKRVQTFFYVNREAPKASFFLPLFRVNANVKKKTMSNAVYNLFRWLPQSGIRNHEMKLRESWNFIAGSTCGRKEKDKKIKRANSERRIRLSPCLF